jgi:hypothetical protein
MPEPNSAVAAKSDASDALRAVDPNATFLLRVRGDRLREGPVFGAIDGLKQGIPQARQGLTILQAGCGFDPVQSIQEIVIAGDHHHSSDTQDPLGRMRVDPRTATAAILLDRPAEDALKCLQTFVPVQPTQVGDHKALMLPTGGVLLAQNELLIYAPEGQAEAASQRVASAAPLSPGVQATLDGNPDSMLLAYGAGNNGLDLKWASLSISQPAGGILVKGIGLAESAEAAEQVKQKVLAQLALAKQLIAQQTSGGEAGDQVGQILDKVSMESNEANVNLRLELDKTQAQQFFSEVVVALAKEGLVKYAMAAKTAEARDNVMRIALALSDYARANPAPKRRFPKSASLSPATVPGKSAVDPTGFDHPSWKAINFAPRERVLYSYEFVTAADGNSVEVIARGDLDGDGQQAKYSVSVSIEGKDPKIAGQILKEQPYE